ncbi:hypothetical protein [Salinigranum marinum]|uniref:hypothetical protein n=1 Tax=Salinigranum marinum TaxID=1515595 RepID=UPI002989EBA3|nr:hypothetical protein [Salinigranum marinum]
MDLGVAKSVTEELQFLDPLVDRRDREEAASGVVLNVIVCDQVDRPAATLAVLRCGGCCLLIWRL